MASRWIALVLVLVLALVAGHAARIAPPPAIHAGQSAALDGASLPPAHAQRSQKRLDMPRRDARRASHERPPALLPPLPAAPPLIRVAIIELPAAHSGRGRAPGPLAVARAPPAA